MSMVPGTVGCRTCCLLYSRCLFTTVSPTKTAEPIEMLFGMWTEVGPGNHVLGGVPDFPRGRGKFGRGAFPGTL